MKRPVALVSCLAPLADNEVQFFLATESLLKNQGIDLVLLLGFVHPSLKHLCIPWLTNSEMWSRLYRVPSSMEFDIDLPRFWFERTRFVRGDIPDEQVQMLVSGIVLVCNKLLELLNPAVVVSWNPADPSTGILQELANRKGIPVSALERGMLPATLNIDSELCGISNSLCGKSFEDLGIDESDESKVVVAKEFCKNKFSGKFTRWIDLESHEQVFDSDKKAVLVLGAFDSACGIIPGDPEKETVLPGYNSGFDLALAVSKATDSQVYFKPHPHFRRFDENEVFPANLHVVETDVIKLISKADVVVSYGTTLEYFALSMEKPVILCGRSALTNKQIAIEAFFAHDLPDALNTALQQCDEKLNNGRFYSFVSFLLNDYLLQIDTSRDIKRSSENWSQYLVDLIDCSVVSELSIDEVKNKLVNKTSMFIYQSLRRLRKRFPGAFVICQKGKHFLKSLATGASP